MTPPSPKTAEEMLAKVIEAQVRGGYGRYELLLMQERCEYDADSVRFLNNTKGDRLRFTFLEILLDPEGLKASYGEEIRCHYPSYSNKAHTILDSWLSGGAEKAIKTAFEHLPSKP